MTNRLTATGTSLRLVHDAPARERGTVVPFPPACPPVALVPDPGSLLAPGVYAIPNLAPRYIPCPEPQLLLDRARPFLTAELQALAAVAVPVMLASQHKPIWSRPTTGTFTVLLSVSCEPVVVPRVVSGAEVPWQRVRRPAPAWSLPFRLQGRSWVAHTTSTRGALRVQLHLPPSLAGDEAWTMVTLGCGPQARSSLHAEGFRFVRRDAAWELASHHSPRAIAPRRPDPWGPLPG